MNKTTKPSLKIFILYIFMRYTFISHKKRQR